MTRAPELEQELWRLAEDLADVAAARSLPLFRSAGLVAANKAAQGFDPVTAADRDAERAMRALLAERRPDDGILGEEFGPEPGRSGLTWVLDPIDGTRAFLSGATDLGDADRPRRRRGPVLGLIDQPYIGERFMGGARPRRAGARRRGAAARGARLRRARRRGALHHLSRDRQPGESAQPSRRCATGCG